jgi:hypothetical protein
VEKIWESAKKTREDVVVGKSCSGLGVCGGFLNEWAA